MKVIIAEKPSVARDIAVVLGLKNNKTGYIYGPDLAITWAFGHLVTLQEPGEYDPALKRWSLETLPFIPSKFKLKLINNRGSAEQFKIIADLCQKADEIICATDAGREGELIFRYILTQAECEDKPIKRLWLNSLTTEAIKTAFKTLKNGHEYDPLYEAARCRSEADWIVGLNSTRYYTVRHGRIGGGSDRVLWTIGRVQTPVLAMIVQRDDIIQQFEPKPFWELATKYRSVTFTYKGKRFTKEDKAQKILTKITDQEFTITGTTAKKKIEKPPQLFDLTTLQREINKQYGLSASASLNACQSLYEKKLVTYPRTDSRYLSNDMKSAMADIFTKLQPLWPEQIAALDLNKLPTNKRIFDDSKVTDHHAIIPTGITPRNLTTDEQLVYNAITIQFIAAFYPNCLKNITTVEGLCNNEKFQAKGTETVAAGWTILFPKKQQTSKTGDQDLPAFTNNESGPHEPYLHQGKTKPPNYFSENSLLGAMEAAGKFIEDDNLREALKERGIGTPATRAAIIETLLRRNYIKRQKKQIRCTDMGRCLIALIQDPLLKSPEMTGEWEENLKQIERGHLSSKDFMANITDYIKKLVDNKPQTKQLDHSQWGNCPRCGNIIVKGKRAYGCSKWQEGCTFVFEPTYNDLELSPKQIKFLLQQGLVPNPIKINNEPRLLILSTQGQAMDLSRPAADRQNHKKSA